MKRSWTFYPMTPHRFYRIAIVLAVLSAFLSHSWAQTFSQQGPPLVGTGAVGAAGQGTSVALSGDGNTAIVGGLGDNGGAGAAWVFTRSGGVWSQQGTKLVGTGAVGAAKQGTSVALSADGNTAIVGGPWDNSLNGAAWVFTRSNGVWSQQGSKLVHPIGFPAWWPVGRGQGTSVALSADGNTAIVGGPYGRDADIGAAFVFTRSAGAWSEQGSLVGWDARQDPDWFAAFDIHEGWSVALSADGNTAILGGPNDNALVYENGYIDDPCFGAGPIPGCYQVIGAAWVFTRWGGGWSEQSKLVGTDATWRPTSNQGYSVALSADGNTAISGGPGESAAWVFTRSGGAWSQQGPQLLGAGGSSVALSADGNTAIVGGDATCVFKRSAGVWSQWGNKLGHSASVALSADGNTAILGRPGDNSGAGAAYVYTAPSRVKLNVTTTPSSGATGTTYVNIIGSGFPKGTVNPANVSVKLAASCGGPPLGTTHASSVVPIIGTSERVQFRIPSLAPGLYYVTISDLAGGDANFSSLNCSKLTVTGL